MPALNPVRIIALSLFSDLTRMVTMQNLYHDGGYSTTGVSMEIMERLESNLVLGIWRCQ